MIRLFYTLLMLIAYPLMVIVGLFNSKIKRKFQETGNNWTNPPKQSKVYWFHCASLGEFDMAIPVIDAFKKKQPDSWIVVTFFSPSGMDHYHKRKHQADHCTYLPFDLPWKIKRFVEHFQPHSCLLVKYEFWPNLIHALHKRNCIITSIGTVLRSDQRYFKWWGKLFRDTLKKVDFFYVQTEQTARLLDKLKIDRYLVSGDTRYDRVVSNKLQVEKNQVIEQFLNGEKAIILGSSWPIDEQLLLPYLTQYQHRLIIAPHDISPAHLKKIEQLIEGFTYSRYSTYDGSSVSILLLDTIGHLTSAYQYGKWAYVGGGFTGKLHNILEPAVYGLPVVFGPRHHRFSEAQQFIDEGFGFSIGENDSIEHIVEQIESNHSALAKNASSFIELQVGASQRIVDHYFT